MKLINMSNNPELYMVNFWRRFLEKTGADVQTIATILDDVKKNPSLYRVPQDEDKTIIYN